jgi:FlaA1/EpsC-like NDP-sugar epimerase
MKIEYTGVRPGEKLFEELGFDAEKMRLTRHPKIFEGTMAPTAWDRMAGGLEALARVTGPASAAEVRRALRSVVPEMIEAGPAVAKPEAPPETEPPRSEPIAEPAPSRRAVQTALGTTG